MLKKNSKVDLVLNPHLNYGPLKMIRGVQFTPREIDIVAWLLSGKSSKTVAHFLSIEEKTVETHKYNIMRKLECNSKEGIIDFIEKSDEFLFVKKHYLGMLMETTFEKHLKEILGLGGKNNPTCFVIYWKEQETKTPLMAQLQKHLKLAGIKIVAERREDYKSLNHLVHQVESQPIDHIIYALPQALMNKIENEDSQENREIFPFIQRASQFPGSVTFLLKNRDILTPFPDAVKALGSIDFTKQEAYYLNFFELLKRLLPETNMEKIILAFQKHYEIIYGSSEKGFPDLWPEEKEARQKETFGNKEGFRGVLKRHPVPLFAAGFLFLSVLGLMISLRESNSFSSPAKISVIASARSELPIPHDNVLLARSNLISDIDTGFKKGNQDIKTLALVGIGGSGKTVIARQYARHQKGVVWEAPSETTRSLRESFENFAYLLATTEEEKRQLRDLKDMRDPEEKEEKIILFVKEHLKANPGWFLIFDNVEQFQDIRKYFPSDGSVWGKGKVMITTRNGNMEAHIAIHQTLHVKELTPEEKRVLFVKILNAGGEPLLPPEKERIQAFLSALPSFPLDISIAAYYLKATNISYEEYIKNISDYKSAFDSVQNHILSEVGAYSKTRYNIVTLSLEKIMKESKDFAEILLLMSLIDSHNIPKELLDSFKNSVVVDDFIHHLKKFSLAMTPPLSEGMSIPCITIHRSTQDIALVYLMKELRIDKNSSLLKDISYALDSYTNKALEEEDFLRMKVSASHAEAFVKHAPLFPDLVTGLIGSKLGCLYYFLNDQTRAEKTIEASLNSLDPILLKGAEEEKIKVAQAFLHIGNVYTELSNYEKAKSILEKSLKIYNQAPSKDYLKVSWGLAHLANAYRRSGYYIKAKDLLEESLALQNQYGLENQGRIARTLAYLGSVYRGLGHYEKSIETLEQSLQIYQQHFPEEHFRIGWVLCHLGNIYRKLGHYEKSIQVLEDGLKIYRKHFSENHIMVGLMLTYLGNSYRGLGDSETAKKFLEEGLKIHEKHFKEGHERIGRILFHLGNVYRELGDHEKSKDFFRQALVIYEKNHGKGEIEMARVFRNMGGIHLLENRLEEAESLIQKSLEILNRHNHPEAYISLESMAELWVKRSEQAAKEGNPAQSQHFKDQAIHQLNQALHIMEGHFPPTSAHIQKIRLKIHKMREASP